MPGGAFRSEEDLFTDLCINDINRFSFICKQRLRVTADQEEENTDSRAQVLLFPKLDSKRRYLVHKATDVFPQYTSFSVGGEENRQTAIVSKDALLLHIAINSKQALDKGTRLDKRELLNQMNLLNKIESNDVEESSDCRRLRETLYEIQALPDAAAGNGGDSKNNTITAETKRRKIKAGAQVYIPPKARNQGSVAAKAAPPTATKIAQSSNKNEISEQISTEGLKKMLNDMNRNAVLPPDAEIQPDSVICDDDTETLEERIRRDLLIAIGHCNVHRPEIGIAKGVYEHFTPKAPRFDVTRVAHCLEVFDFDSNMSEAQLRICLGSFTKDEYRFVWVDDTHVILVMASSELCFQALCYSYSDIKLTDMKNASLQTKIKVAKNFESISQPYKPRPATTSFAAHRMVAGALGVRVNRARIDAEKDKLRDAKMKRDQADNSPVHVQQMQVASSPETTASSAAVLSDSSDESDLEFGNYAEMQDDPPKLKAPDRSYLDDLVDDDVCEDKNQYLNDLCDDDDN